MNMAGNWCRMDEEWMKNGWKSAWKWITNERKMDRRCSKKSCSKDFGLPSTKNSTWEPNLEWRVLLLFWANCFWKSAVRQLCAKTHSMFRVPDLFWLTGAVFRNISVTHSKFSKRKKCSKTWDFGPARRNGNFSDTPGDFQKVILCFGPALYIYKDMCVRMYLYTLPEMMYINSDGPKLRMTKNTAACGAKPNWERPLVV